MTYPEPNSLTEAVEALGEAVLEFGADLGRSLKAVAPLAAWFLPLLIALAVVTTVAWGQTVCGDRNEFLTHLSKGYGEHPAAMGLASNGSVLEVLRSAKGSWTIIITRPDGTSCVVAAGESWEEFPQLKRGPTA